MNGTRTKTPIAAEGKNDATQTSLGVADAPSATSSPASLPLESNAASLSEFLFARMPNPSLPEIVDNEPSPPVISCISTSSVQSTVLLLAAQTESRVNPGCSRPTTPGGSINPIIPRDLSEEPIQSSGVLHRFRQYWENRLYRRWLKTWRCLVPSMSANIAGLTPVPLMFNVHPPAMQLMVYEGAFIQWTMTIDRILKTPTMHTQAFVNTLVCNLTAIHALSETTERMAIYHVGVMMEAMEVHVLMCLMWLVLNANLMVVEDVFMLCNLAMLEKAFAMLKKLALPASL